LIDDQWYVNVNVALVLEFNFAFSFVLLSSFVFGLPEVVSLQTGLEYEH